MLDVECHREPEIFGDEIADTLKHLTVNWRRERKVDRTVGKGELDQKS